MRIWIRNPLAILAGDDAAGGLVVEGDRIAECLAAGAAPATPCDHNFDASGHVVLPGLINTHHHFYQTLARACGPALGKELFDWLEVLYPIWAKLTPDQLDVASRFALAELLLSGCTTAADHHSRAQYRSCSVVLDKPADRSNHMRRRNGGLPACETVPKLPFIPCFSRAMLRPETPPVRFPERGKRGRPRFCTTTNPPCWTLSIGGR